MTSPSVLRPPISRQHSRVPGTFDTDDELSPIKTTFEFSEGIDRSEAFEPASERPGENDNSAIIAPSEDGNSHIGTEASLLDESEMRRRLMDLEPSFLSELSPAGPQGNSGADDTFVFGSPHSESRQVNPDWKVSKPEHSTSKYGKDNNQHYTSPQSPSTPPDAYQTPAPNRDIESTKNLDTEDDSYNTSSLETISSSPTAAAAARTVSRVISIASMGGYETADEQQLDSSAQKPRQLSNVDEEATPKKLESSTRPLSPVGSPTPTRTATLENFDEGANGDVDEETHSIRSPRKRPKTLKSRLSSQRSSYSSHTTTSTELGSDVTLGADYALQSGGAVPFSSSGSSRPHMDLSRSISLGSIASGISALSDGDDKPRSVSTATDGLDPLPEEEDFIGIGRSLRGRGEEPSLPQTPRATSRSLNTPTDTVIAQHVKDIEVPGTVARGFRDRFQTSSPDRKNGLPVNGRAGKNMTLKEQSSTIDRLQKENWDLKLKITFLDNALNKRSDEGVKSMISENVELRTSKYNSAKEIRDLKRSVRELEYKLKDREERLASRIKEEEERSESRTHSTEDGGGLETELTFLRERVETYEVQVEKLRQESAGKEGEKRRLAEVVKSLSERRNGASDIGVREEVDMWKDLLEAETARREQADVENRRLREEVWRLKSDAASNLTKNNALNSTRMERRHESGSLNINDASNTIDQDQSNSAATTLVEQLKHENAELRREVGAQTSMLTSRNREKERLYQEIEDLKMGSRRGDGIRSVAGDSIFERSASRAHGRSVSRASDMTRITQMSDAERESYEMKNGELRDGISKLKLEKQELLINLDNVLDELDHHANIKSDLEKVEQAYDDALQDLRTMQGERDEALRLHEDTESNLQSLKEEAQQTLDTLEDELDQKTELLERLEAELSSRDEESKSLRNEVRMMGEGLARVEDDVQSKIRRIQEIELENEDINRELENLEKGLLEANGKSEKLVIELESRQGECAFLREEQDGCMIKIGDLETNTKTTKASLDSEREKTRDLEARLAEERHQREVISSKEKQEVQKLMNDLNREASNAKEDSRKLRKNLETREIEVKTWKERLTELENGLRDTLGEPNGTKSSFLMSISKLQSDLDNASSELHAFRNSLSEKERVLQKRDALLESHSLESRKLSELLEKERQGRRADKAQHEQWQKTHQHTSRTVTQKDTRITELESARQSDRKKLAGLEQQYKEQLTERNNLLLTLWNRLSTLCGSDWQHQNSLVSGHLPTLEVVSGMLLGFSKNLLLAVKTIEILIDNFKTRIRGIERDFAKDFQALEHNLDMRNKRLDRLESAVQVSKVSNAASAAPEIAKLRGENHLLRAELSVLQKQGMHNRTARSDGRASPSSSIHRAPTTNHRASMTATLTRHFSGSAVDELERRRDERGSGASSAAAAAAQAVIASQPIEPSQQRWVHRLKELERRLKAEREARLLDRSGARKRLEEGRAENEELKRELERERVRREGG